MARFEIDTDKGRHHYETDGCRLTTPDGQRVDLSRFGYEYVAGVPGRDQIAFSPDNPIIGKDQPKALKIQLGLGCNMSCSYCSQDGQKEMASSSQDAKHFLKNLEGWLSVEPEKIEFWGGEPMLYWKKIEILAPALRSRFPHARMSVVTNGTLLDYRKAQILHDLGFTLAVSHDGPGQALRGNDPFDDAAWLETLRAIFRLFGERICFNAVITTKNLDLVEMLLWFERRMGFPVKVNVEDVVKDYGTAGWTPHELAALSQSIKASVSSGLALIFPRLRWSVQQFMETLAIEKPLAGSNQVCQMDRQDHLAVDLHGNVLTCQNAGAQSGHGIGNVENLPAVRMNTGHSWATRPNCPTCPVVHLCYGSCMFLTGPAFESSCQASYHYNRAILEGAIYLLTGARVRGINHELHQRQVIPIKEIAS